MYESLGFLRFEKMDLKIIEEQWEVYPFRTNKGLMNNNNNKTAAAPAGNNTVLKFKSM